MKKLISIKKEWERINIPLRLPINFFKKMLRISICSKIIYSKMLDIKMDVFDCDEYDERITEIEKRIGIYKELVYSARPDPRYKELKEKHINVFKKLLDL